MSSTVEPKPEFPGQVNPTECEDVGLECKNGGFCKYGQITIGLDFDETYDPVPYCACPLNWTGSMCEIPIVQCDSSAQYCYNNGTCLKSSKILEKDNDDQYTCDCSTAIYEDSTGLIRIFAGSFCEYPHDSVCNENESLLEIVSNGSFCVNLGICVYSNSNTYECVCPSTWEGDHCEVRKPIDNTQPIDSSLNDSLEDSSAFTAIILISFGSLLFLTLVVMMMRRFCVQAADKHQKLFAVNNTSDGEERVVVPIL